MAALDGRKEWSPGYAYLSTVRHHQSEPNKFLHGRRRTRPYSFMLNINPFNGALRMVERGVYDARQVGRMIAREQM